MSDYSYLMLLQVFTPMHVLLHIHVLTCINVLITVRSHDHPKQIIALMLTILSIPLFTYVCLKLSVAHYCTYTMIIIIIMLNDHTQHMYLLKSPMLPIIMVINLYDHCKCCELILYDHAPYMYYLLYYHCFLCENCMF